MLKKLVAAAAVFVVLTAVVLVVVKPLSIWDNTNTTILSNVPYTSFTNTVDYHNCADAFHAKYPAQEVPDSCYIVKVDLAVKTLDCWCFKKS